MLWFVAPLWYVGSADVMQGYHFQLTISHEHKENFPLITDFVNRSTLRKTPEEEKGKDLTERVIFETVLTWSLCDVTAASDKLKVPANNH